MRTNAGWFRATLSATGNRRGWIAWQRRSISSLLLLAGGLLASARPKKRSTRIVRAVTRCAQRSWIALGRVRSARKAAAGKFSSSFLARCAGRLRPNSGRRGHDVRSRRLGLHLARRNEPPNQILDANDPAKVVLPIDDSCQTDSRSA